MAFRMRGLYRSVSTQTWKEMLVASLQIRNFPKGLHAAIRKIAENNGRSVSEEVLVVLKKAFPTTREMAKRKNALQRLSNCRFTSSSKDKMPDSLEMIREDRER
jgi:plasmid stability protein